MRSDFECVVGAIQKFERIFHECKRTLCVCSLKRCFPHRHGPPRLSGWTPPTPLYTNRLRSDNNSKARSKPSGTARGVYARLHEHRDELRDVLESA